MEKDYTGYSADRLLNDEYFVESALHPTQKSKIFWGLMQEDKELGKEMAIAYSFIRAVKNLNTPIPENEKAELWDRIMTNNRRRHKIKRLRRTAAAASCAAIILSAGIYLIGIRHNEHPDIMTAAENIVDLDKLENITLISSGRKSYSIADPFNCIRYDSKGNAVVDSGDALTIPGKKNNDLNQLLVPPGKRTKVILSDGTTAWLNVNSRLIYPPKFASKKREVYVEGEVLFDVRPDRSHPFIVRTIQADVKVLGTLFNVKTGSDKAMSVILADGSVEVSDRQGQILQLSPDEIMTIVDGKIINKKHIDASGYVSWAEGILLLNGDALGDVLNRLGDYYGIAVIPDPAVRDIPIYGKLDLNNTIDYLLELISMSSPVYVTVSDGTYYIHKNRETK